jgi:hypothetical protein
MRASRRLSLAILRYALLFMFSIVGFYYLLASVQCASFSVPAEPVMSEIHKTRAVLCLPISMLMFPVGGLAFVCLGDTHEAEIVGVE